MSDLDVKRRNNRRLNNQAKKWANEFAHNPYIGSFHRKQKMTNLASTTHSLLPSSSPHVGTFRHSPQTTSQGLKELLWEENNLAMPFISQIQLAQQNKYAKRHVAKKALDDIPSTRFASSGTSTDAPVCAICLESFVDGDELRTLSCGHCFHRGCVDIWLLGTLSEDSLVTSICPTCRRDLSSSSSTVLVNISVVESSAADAVMSPSDDSSSISEDIPRECFLRIGQFLFEQSNLPDDADQTPSEDSPYAGVHGFALPALTTPSMHFGGE